MEKLNETVYFEPFPADLIAAMPPHDPAKGGHPGFELVLKFRMLVLQSLHGLSLEQTQYLLRARVGWMQFCELRR